MASSSGNSSGSSKYTQLQNSGSEEELQITILDQKKRKRKESNRESARRSRLRKQKHTDDLMIRVAQLTTDKDQILANIDITRQQYLDVESENCVLRAQVIELTQRLQSLNEIINYMNINNGWFGTEDFQTIPDSFINNSWNLMYHNQPMIMASADMYQY